MNKIFKIIWSKARNCYVVVSEIAHCRGKGQGQKRAIFTCSLAAALAVFTLTGGVTAVQAETGTNAYAAGVNANATGENATAVGHSASATGNNATAVGNGAKASDENATAVGNNAEASKKNAVAVGNGAKALAEDAMAIGNRANVGEKGNASLAIGTGAQASGKNDIVIGHDAKNESNQSDGLIVIGHGATVSNNGTPKNSIAIGTSANVVGENNIAIGTSAVVTNNGGNNAISLGTEAKAEKSESIAIGMKAHANNNDGIAAIAIGSGAEAQKDKSIAIGYKALANNNGESGGIAIGSSIVDSQGKIITQTTAAQGNDIAFGVGAQTANNNMNGHNGGSIAIGHLSYSRGNQDVAIGDNAKTGRDGNNAGSPKRWGDGEGYVAIGANSFSNVGPGVRGYDPHTQKSHEFQDKEAHAVWESTNGAVSVGNVSGDSGTWITRQITGVAAGSADTDAVNVAQLKQAIANSGSSGGDSNHSTVTVGKQGVPGDKGTVQGGNLTLTKTTNGASNYDLSLNKDIVLGKDGKDGEEGSIGLAGKDGEQGYSTTTIKTEKGQRGADGKDGKPGVNGSDITRIVYGQGTDGTNNKQVVATLDDGQKYAGDNYIPVTEKNAEQNVITKKLNERLDIKGGATGTLTENNIGVNVESGVMKVQLAQNIDLGGSGSVTMGNTTINNGGVTITTKNGDNTNTISLTKDGLNNGGKTITHVGNGTNDSDAVNVSQLNAAKTTVKSSDNSISVTDTSNGTPNHAYDIKVATATLSNGADGKVSVTNPNNNANSYATGNSVAAAINNSGFTLTTSNSGGGSVSGTSTQLINPGSTVTLDAGKNIALTQAGSKVTIALSDDVTTQTITANGKNGNDGEIGLTGKNGAGGKVTTIIKTIGENGTNGKDGKPGINGTDGITRLVYQDGKDGTTPHTVATLDDGLKFIGDKSDDTAIAKKLSETLTIKGDGTYDATTKINTGNIQTSVDGGAIKVALNKDINLHQNGSLTVGGSEKGDAADENAPIVIKHFDAGKLTVIGTDKDGNKPQSAAGDYVTGLDNKDWDVTNPTYVSGRAATEDQLKEISDTIKSNADTAAGQHTEITVNDKKAPTIVPSDKVGTTDYGDYVGGNDNLLIAAKKDTTSGKIIYNIKLNDQLTIGQKGEPGKPGTPGKDGKFTVETSKGTTVVIGHDGEPGKDGKDGISVKDKDGKDGVTISVSNGKDGKDGSEGHIGLTGPAGKDGKNASADIHVKNGQNGVDGTDGNNGKDGMDRVVYEDHNGKTHEVATLDDGLKFVGNDGQEVTRKLNTTLSIKGGITDATALKNASAKNLGVRQNADKDGLEIVMTDTPDFTKVTVGEGNDPNSKITIGKQTVTGKKSDGNPSDKSQTGNYITGLDNKAWDKDNVVENRAATEGQLKEAINDIKGSTNGGFGLAAEKGGSVKKDLGQTITVKGDTVYAKDGKTVVKDGNIKTSVDGDAIKISLNDQISVGQKSADGQNGKDGKVTVETKGGTTVIIGHDGKDGEDGKDGLFVTGPSGKDGKDGNASVSITGPNGKDGKDGVDGKVGIAGKDGKDAVSIAGKDGVGHIGLTGPKGEKGADGTPGRDGISIDITTDLKAPTLDDGKNVTTVIKDKEGKETTITQAPRIQYESNGKNYEVATMDDGLKFVGNDGKEVTKKLNSTLSLTGGMDKDAVAKASSKNLGVRSNKDGDGLEIVMTDTPDFTKVTVGEGNDPNSKITIGKQTVTGKKSDGTDGTAETGKYITGLDNTQWNKDNVVENRAATEGQLRDIAGSITNQNQGGGFALTSDEKGADKIVKQDLGKAIQIKGDTAYKTDGTVEKAGNIKTSIDNGAIKVELNKDVDLTKDGSIKAGETTINKGGVDTNKVTIKDSTISISKDGINGGDKQITNVASGASEITKDADGKVSYKYDNETNAANIGDVKRITGDMKTEINNNISNVTNKVDQIGQHVDNIQNDVKQLKTDVKADRTYQGDDGAAKKVKVKFGSFLSLTGGAKLADLTEEGNIGVVQKEIDDPDNKGEKIAGLSVRLAKHLNLEKTTYTSNENGQTYTSEIDGKGLTIKTGDENRNITVQDGNVNMGGNQIHNVAPGQAPGDAVNVSQLNATNQTVANLGGAVNKLGTRVNRVGAGAAALAALHPLDFDPEDKWDFAAGYGNYKDASAVAVGAYYRPNEDTMFSVGGSFGGGENMVNAGVSFKVGQGNHVSTSRVAMAKEIKDLRQDVANLNAIVNRQSALINKLTGTNAGTVQDAGNDLFPDVPANHWAYEYVTKLKQAGILTGYPDGNFDGDRMMTRYEFAAIVYRAIMAGAASNPALSQDGTLDKLAKEFSPEMKHIRIDTIAKDKNGKPTIERVRVIPEAKQ